MPPDEWNRYPVRTKVVALALQVARWLVYLWGSDRDSAMTSL
jgi:hypothetical protein